MKKLIMLGLLAVAVGVAVKVYPKETEKLVDMTQSEIDKRLKKINDILNKRV